ncbi:alpha/beta hydrolase family protein [Acidisoma silvae]|uniref:AB hydrolase-1 domain-containing protein n=1 Tax=Acidisoma silvae TaxID=2802396 RepID=A0A963YSN9_9PROT|nr:alpha/beta fold hydrolase [Acidisoma silvae]MCB8875994.1 hypothetical protein [Acidisoma silvae]
MTGTLKIEPKKRRAMKVGLRTGLLLDNTPTSWSEDAPRPVRWSAWYPASDDAIAIVEKSDLFDIGTIARNAAINNRRPTYSTVLLSHGTGGAAISLNWLATRLAAEGYIVIGPDHHGNTVTEPFHPAGFAAWWERARDLTFALDALSTEGFLSGHIGGDISAIGFSLGGYTAMCLLGAVTDFELFKAWAHKNGARRGPPQFPDLPDLMPGLMMEPAFLESWARQSQSYKDSRVRRAILLAPAPPVRAFTPESLATITEPVTIMVGGDDHEAPADACAAWLNTQIPTSELYNLGDRVGHATFLGLGTDRSRKESPDLYVDNFGVDRALIHESVVALTLTALGFGSGISRNLL